MRHIITAICCIMLFGCAIDPLGHKAIRSTPITLTNDTKSLSVMAFIDTLEVGKKVGKFYVGAACIFKEKTQWQSGVKLLNSAPDIIRIKLGKQGYSLADKPYSPFNEEHRKNAELLLGGRIIDAESNLCSSVKGYKGQLYMKIEWEIYDNKAGNVILTFTTEGTSSINEFDNIGQTKLFEQALDMSIDNLLADNSFFSILTKR